MTSVQASVVLVAALAGALMAARAAMDGEGRARLGWALVAVAAGLSAGAGGLAIVGQEAGVAAALATSTTVSAVAVLWLLPQPASRFALFHSILDGIILLSALLFMGWALLLDQLVAGRGAWGAIEALAHPFSAIVLMTAVLVMVTKPHRHASLWWILLAAGLAAQAGGELGAARVELTGGTGAGWLRSVAIGLGWLLVARAAASRRDVGRAEPAARWPG